MLTKKERMEKLNNAGVNISKYFTVDLDNGTKIHLIIDEENGVLKQVQDSVMSQIIEDGYVRNTKLHRRFVMAQMFHMLNYVSYDGKYRGYNDCLKRSYGYEYTLKMMADEIKVLSKLEVRDVESFTERSNFFNKKVVISVLEDYLEKFKAYVETLPNKNCKGIPYKRIKGKDIFNADLDKKLYTPVRNHIFKIKYAKNYSEIYRALGAFMKSHVNLPYETAKSKVWVDAYKGEGAFYTLKNLVMFHNCDVEIERDFGQVYKVSNEDAMQLLNQKLDEYKGEGWRMFALMKKVIEDNGINTQTYIGEICNK